MGEPRAHTYTYIRTHIRIHTIHTPANTQFRFPWELQPPVSEEAHGEEGAHTHTHACTHNTHIIHIIHITQYRLRWVSCSPL